MEYRKIYMEKLRERMLIEFARQDRSGVYGYTQKQMAYNSNRIEGSRLNKKQTAGLFDTGSMAADGSLVRAKDVEEMTGHFLMFNRMLETYDQELSHSLVKSYHYALKAGVFEDMANGYPCGEYKSRRNIVGSIQTALPEEVPSRMQELFDWYESKSKISISTLAELHIRYERIHPFQDGNGRTGRMILYKECLRHDIVPFVIEDSKKSEYYHSLDDASSLAGFFNREQKIYLRETEGLVLPEGTVRKIHDSYDGLDLE